MIKSVEELNEKTKLLNEMQKKLNEMETDENVSNEEYENYKDDCEMLFEEIYGRDTYQGY